MHTDVVESFSGEIAVAAAEAYGQDGGHGNCWYLVMAADRRKEGN